MNLKQRFKLSRFIRGEKETNKPITLSHRRIFILPTKSGLGFAGLIVLLLLMAFIYNNNLAYMLAFLLVSVFIITILHTFRSLSALVLSPAQSVSVFAGESAGFEVLITNPNKNKRLNLKIQLENSEVFSLDEQQKKRITLYSTTHKRGWHYLETITLSSTYPLGLFRAWSPLRFAEKALVYPKPSSIESPFPESESGQHNLQNQTKKTGSDDFYGIKEYQQGDPIRHIHWKAFAKGQGLFSKQYAGGKASELWLNYEQTPGHDVEERLSQLCRWLIDAEKMGLRYGLNIPGFKYDPDHGQTHYFKCLQALALL